MATTDPLAISIITDQPDYGPGETAYFTATTVTFGDTIDFSVAHVDPGADGIVGTADDTLVHDLTGTTGPWLVTDGGAGDLDGVANGVITTSWYVNQDAANQAFVVSVTDNNTGATASTSFTDAGLVVDFKQAANNNGEPGGLGDIDWLSSILQTGNSVYHEGMSVMQRAVFENFTDAGGDGNIVLKFHTDATKGGIHAYDWQTSWDQAITAALNAVCRSSYLCRP